MIVEVNDAGEILVPAELVQAAPPLAEEPVRTSNYISDSLLVLEGQLADPAMTFRREDIYGPDGR